jgi:hypothetical protein
MAEALEGRTMTKGNSEEPTATCTQRQGQALSGLDRIREAARDKTIRSTILMHHITVDLLRDSFYALNRNAASGVDTLTNDFASTTQGRSRMN